MKYNSKTKGKWENRLEMNNLQYKLVRLLLNDYQCLIVLKISKKGSKHMVQIIKT